MFDIGFMELLLVAVVALVVIGPERMPETIRTVLSYVRTIKRSLHNARMDIEREMGMDAIRRDIHNEEILRSLNTPQAAIDAALKNTNSAAQPIRQEAQDIVDSLHAIEKTVADKPHD